MQYTFLDSPFIRLPLRCFSPGCRNRLPLTTGAASSRTEKQNTHSQDMFVTLQRRSEHLPPNAASCWVRVVSWLPHWTGCIVQSKTMHPRTSAGFVPRCSFLSS